MDLPDRRSQNQTQSGDDDTQPRPEEIRQTLEEVSSTRSERSETPERCVICLDAITEPCELHPCRHNNFDLACLYIWLRVRPQCPLCKGTAIFIHHGPPGRQVVTRAPPILKSTPYDPPPIHTPSVRDARSLVGLWMQQQHDREHYTQLQERLREQLQRDSSPEASAVRRRAEVYGRELYSQHVGSNRYSRFQELTPIMFRNDGQLLSRARMWIRRELRVFSFLDPFVFAAPVRRPWDPPTMNAPQRRVARNAEYLLEYIISILVRMDIKGSAGQAEDMLAEYLGRSNARVFWHELRSWLRSPYTTLEEWDEHVQYDDPTEREEEDYGSRAGPSSRYRGEDVDVDVDEDEREGGASSGSSGHRGGPSNRRLHRRRVAESPPSGSGLSPLARMSGGGGDDHAYHC